MPDLLGLLSLECIDVTETLDRVRCIVRLEIQPPCRNCTGTTMTRHGDAQPLKLLDTPSRGKVTELVLLRPRWHCSSCRATSTARGPDIAAGFPATDRLVQYVENAALRCPAAQVAAETGLSEDNVRKIFAKLQARLERHHRFATPDAIAIDGIQFGRHRTYLVLSDAREGHALLMTASGKADAMLRRIADRLDRDAVKFVVTDLGTENGPLARAFPKALHIADKFHVQGVLQRHISSAISRRLAELRASGHKDKAKTLAAARTTIEGRRNRDHADPDEPILPGIEQPILTQFPELRPAYELRRSVFRFYDARSRSEAEARFDDMLTAAEALRAVSTKEPAKALASSINALTMHRSPIVAYFDTLVTPISGGRPVGLTTARAERRNGMIRAIWRQARGFKHAEPFIARSIYSPFRIGIDLVPCDHVGCATIEGPLSPAALFERSAQSVSQISHFCPAHA